MAAAFAAAWLAAMESLRQRGRRDGEPFTPLTPATPSPPPRPPPSPYCNPMTSTTAVDREGRPECLCKYPDLVINEGSKGDCSHVVACQPGGTLVHRVTRRPFDGTWDPALEGVCECPEGSIVDGHACRPDPCGPHGRRAAPSSSRCLCDDGFVDWEGGCVPDPCGPNGRRADGGSCRCDAGFIPRQDENVPGGWTCEDPCVTLCGSRGTCVTDGRKARCEDCRYPFHQSPDGLCNGRPKDPFEPCDDDDECMSRRCACRREGDRVCCLP